MSLRWTHRTLPLSPQRVAQKRIRSKDWTISCDNSETVYEVGCQLLLITNRKSHTSFRLILTLMTMNDLERHNSPYFAFFTEIDSFAGRLRHSGWRQTYYVRKILSPSSSLPLLAKTNFPCSTVSAISELLVVVKTKCKSPKEMEMGSGAVLVA